METRSDPPTWGLGEVLIISYGKNIYSYDIFICNNALHNKIGPVGGYHFYGEMCCLLIQGSKVPHIFSSRVRFGELGF